MSLTPGATLGPYTILAELGHGGMGVIYTAQDPRLDRQVAIKVLPPSRCTAGANRDRTVYRAGSRLRNVQPHACQNSRTDSVLW